MCLTLLNLKIFKYPIKIFLVLRKKCKVRNLIVDKNYRIGIKYFCLNFYNIINNNNFVKIIKKIFKENINGTYYYYFFFAYILMKCCRNNENINNLDF